MSALQRNRFEFDRNRSDTETDVMLDLEELTDQYWSKAVLPYFGVAVLQGTREVADGRVIYRFRLSNRLAHVLETSIVNAMLQLQGQTN